MLKTKIDTKELNKILGNSVSYSYGFLEGADMNQIEFNTQLGQFIKEALGEYIDASARSNPSALHHVYEWGAAGSEGARLFSFNVRASKRVITFTGRFLPSKSAPPNSGTPFVDKANVMENRIEVVIEPRNSNVLVFEDGGETVFTTNAIYVANPGGDAVAGAFGMTVEEFFGTYLTNAFLRSSGVFKDLETADEYTSSFPAGTKGGKGVGIRAGKKYMTLPAVGL